MDIFIKAAGCVIVTTIFVLALSKSGKDISLLLSVLACCMVALAAMHYLEPVFSFVDRIQILGNINNEMLNIVIKAVGIGLISEFTNLICTDAGNAALGKTLQYLGMIVVLWLSIPLFDNIISLVEDILGSV